MRWIVSSFFLLALIGCAVSPMGRRQLILVPDEEIARLGEEAFLEIQEGMSVEEDPEIKRFVACVSKALIDELEDSHFENWEVLVFQEDSANAFALPGKKIGIHTGLLEIVESQAQLASVVAHEVAHVLARHGHERFSQAQAIHIGLEITEGILQTDEQTRQVLMGVLGLGAHLGISLPYSRAHETEADLMGLQLMAEAGFQPKASIQFWQRMQEASGTKPPQFLSTHPNTQKRINELQAHMSQAQSLYDQHERRPDCTLPK